METSILAALALVSFITGFLDASVGSGGLILLPFLMLVGLPIKSAIATTRMTFIMDSAAGFYGHLKEGNVDIERARPLFLFFGIGAIIGVSITSASPPDILKKVFATFIVLMAAGLFIKVPPGTKLVGMTGLYFGSFAVGVMIGMFGAGLGTVTILLLLLAGFGMLKAAGTSQAVVLFANVFAFFGYYFGGYVDLGIGLFTGVFASLGALTGVKAAVRIGDARLRKFFFAVVIFMAAALTRV